MTSSEAQPDEDNSRKPRAIVAGHGSFAAGLVSAVQQISGCGDVFVTLSNQGLTGEDIETRLRAAAAEADANVFFTDLPAGSATLAVRRIMRENSETVLVTGANLGALLEFVFHPEMSAGEAARLAAEKGRASLVAHGAG
ncbi:MAG TPA: hypothetical protein VM939_03670 [Gemmatimonadaceae bacterium]|nr:hypothetical protein [Gemmatimonadaceae bacterium]